MAWECSHFKTALSFVQGGSWAPRAAPTSLQMGLTVPGLRGCSSPPCSTGLLLQSWFELRGQPGTPMCQEPSAQLAPKLPKHTGSLLKLASKLLRLQLEMSNCFHAAMDRLSLRADTFIDRGFLTYK